MNLNISLGIALLISIMFGGYEHYSYKQFKMEVEAEATKQQIISEQTDKWNKQVIEESTNEYKKRLAAIDTKYGRLHYSSSGTVPDTNSKLDTSGVNATPTDDVSLKRDCAITTTMLVTLQDILKTTKDN